MLKNFRNPLATVLAIAIAVVTLLLGYILPSLFNNTSQNPQATDIRTLLLGWAVILAAVATVVAILSMIAVHFRKLQAKRGKDFYSLFTIVFFLLTFVAGCAVYLLGNSQSDYQKIFVTSIQVPVESSLMAVLAVTLMLACFRLFQRRKGILAVTFLLSALLFLLINSGVTSLFESVLPKDLVGGLLGIIQVLPVAGGRGILLGIALGSIMAGLRIVFGAERPYSG